VKSLAKCPAVVRACSGVGVLGGKGTCPAAGAMHGCHPRRFRGSNNAYMSACLLAAVEGMKGCSAMV